jgi:nicotinamidase-related amidase
MTTALVLIDLQNDYFPGGAMELVGSNDAIAQAKTLLLAFRDRALPVFHVQHISTRPNATFFLPNTTGVDIHSSVRPAVGESITKKHFPSSFRETTLLEYLRAANVTKLVITGMMTHMCVDTTVRAAADLGFTCFLAQDACATRALEFSGHRVEATQVQTSYLAALNGAFAQVLPAQEIIAHHLG